MNPNWYYFFGFFLSKNNMPIKLEGIFDIELKVSISHSSLDLQLSSIIFKKQSLLTCKVSCQNETFKQVKSLDFSFRPAEQVYVARVFSDKPFDRSAIGGRIEKDSTPKEEIGFITLQIARNVLFDFNFVNKNFFQLENPRKREQTVKEH
jgi:hypothetical protein